MAVGVHLKTSFSCYLIFLLQTQQLTSAEDKNTWEENEEGLFGLQKQLSVERLT